MKFQQAQISRKPAQVGTQTRHKHAAKNLRWLPFSFDQGFTTQIWMKKILQVSVEF